MYVVFLKIYERIINLASIKVDQSSEDVLTNDLAQGQEKSLESYSEGNKKERSASYYERNPKLRQQAVLIHGYTCQVCGFNFKKVYGDHGEGFIHVHHNKPVAEYKEEHVVNPREDLSVLCANCHSMIHRYRSKTLSIEQLKEIIK